MNLGLLTYELTRPTLGELFDAVKSCGCRTMEFSFDSWCPGFEADKNPFHVLPNNITKELAQKVCHEARKRGLRISVVNGFYNMIAEDESERDDGLARLETLASVCGMLGCRVINLCTGSRGAHLWAGHPDNDTDAAWHDICRSMEQALAVAELYEVSLGVEVEASNVINTPEKARRLLDDMKSPYLGIVMDGANLFHRGQCKPENVHGILQNAFDLLGDDIIAVHGKDIKAGPGLDFTYAGNGIVDFDYFLARLTLSGFGGDIILHGAHIEEEVPKGVDYMRQKLKEHGM